jgi:hypothetical protein
LGMPGPVTAEGGAHSGGLSLVRLRAPGDAMEDAHRPDSLSHSRRDSG